MAGPLDRTLDDGQNLWRDCQYSQIRYNADGPETVNLRAALNTDDLSWRPPMSATNPTTSVEYRDIPDYPGYRVGTDCSVWSCLGIGGLLHGAITSNWRRKTLHVSKQGYHAVRLRRQTITVHTLMLSAFVGPKPPGHECRHLNGNRLDNRLDNLAWGTHAENISDSFRHGTNGKGMKSHTPKLTDDEVREIRRLRAENVCRRQVAARFGVTMATITRVVNCSRRGGWGHVE